ncbi:MAG TPA: DNA polymerase III subunit delta, partial [Acidimicrobiales bacterium]|nr:DNA polymerase III subunit delta [Acidimicrobiales bacterium]
MAADWPTGGGPAVWLVDGDDATLVADAVHALVDRLAGPADKTLVVEDYRDEELDLAAVADASQTPPFLADRRVVVIRDIGRFGTDEVAPLLAYLDAPLPTTALVLAAGGGRLAPKLAAAVKAAGRVVATAVSSRDAAGWVRDRLRHAPVRFEPAAESLIEAHLGEDVGRLGALIDVLAAAYGEGARLGPADVEAYLGEAGPVAPWDLTDAIDRGDPGEALRLLHRMLGAGERHPLVVAAVLNRHYASMLRLDDPAITSE